jgi:predicted kinase
MSLLSYKYYLPFFFVPSTTIHLSSLFTSPFCDTHITCGKLSMSSEALTTENSLFCTSSDVTCCVLVVCGIPGSGKSTLARWLHAACKKNKISSHVLSFDDYEVSSAMWDSKSFLKSRESSLVALEELFNEQTSYRLIIVDDIMYYGSMRRRVYQLARQCGAGYAVVHVDVPLALAQARNAARPEATRVHEEVSQRLVVRESNC